MSESVLKSILKFVHSKSSDIRTAAIKILGELGIADKEIIETLKKLVNDEDKNIRLLSLEALSKFKNIETLKIIDNMLGFEDDYTTNALKNYYANYGNLASEYIASKWQEAELRKKQHYIDVLSFIKTKKSHELILNSIVDSNHQISNSSTRIILEKFDSLDEEFIESFTIKVKSFIKDISKTKDTIEQYIPAILNIVKILKNIETPSSLKLIGELFSLNIPQISTQLAFAAIKLYQNDKLRDRNIEDFLSIFKTICYLTKTSQLENISAIYIELNKITLHPKLYHIALQLYESTAIFEVKRWIINYMNNIATTASIEFLIEKLYKESKEIQLEIIAAIKKNPSLSNTIIKELYKCKNASIVPYLVDVLKSYKIIWPTERLNEFVESGIKMLHSSIRNQKKSDLCFSIAKGLFELTASITPEIVRGKLLEEATGCKNSRNFTLGDLIFQILNTPILATSDTRFEFAIFKLMSYPPQKLLDEKLYTISIDIFSELLKIPRFNILDRIKAQKKFIQPGHYLYIATYFLKGLPHERIFAKEILKFVTSNYPRANKIMKLAQELLASTI